jgi:hypothetical protein
MAVEADIGRIRPLEQRTQGEDIEDMGDIAGRTRKKRTLKEY